MKSSMPDDALPPPARPLEANPQPGPGLDPATAAARLLTEGANELGPPERRKLWGIAAEVAREPMFLLLFELEKKMRPSAESNNGIC